MQLQLQQNSQLSQQLQRQQVLSATPAQLSQVKAFVSQAQLQASLSRSNSPVGAAVSNQSSASTSAAQTTSSPLTTSIQLQAQQVSVGIHRFSSRWLVLECIVLLLCKATNNIPFNSL